MKFQLITNQVQAHFGSGAKGEYSDPIAKLAFDRGETSDEPVLLDVYGTFDSGGYCAHFCCIAGTRINVTSILHVSDFDALNKFMNCNCENFEEVDAKQREEHRIEMALHNRAARAETYAARREMAEAH